MSFRIKAGDEVLKNHLESCAKNASYISKTTQNDLILCCGTVILQKLTSLVKGARLFIILADECCDSSNKEQMALVLRYFDCCNVVIFGHKNGCAAKILKINNKALYTHCFSHRLNLTMLIFDIYVTFVLVSVEFLKF